MPELHDLNTDFGRSDNIADKLDKRALEVDRPQMTPAEIKQLEEAAEAARTPFYGVSVLVPEPVGIVEALHLGG